MISWRRFGPIAFDKRHYRRCTCAQRGKDTLRSSTLPMPLRPKQPPGCYCVGRIRQIAALRARPVGVSSYRRNRRKTCTVEELQHLAHAYPVPLGHQLDRPPIPPPSTATRFHGCCDDPPRHPAARLARHRVPRPGARRGRVASTAAPAPRAVAHPGAEPHPARSTAAGVVPVRGLHPLAWSLFQRFTFELIDRGFAHYSSDAVLHVGGGGKRLSP